jgi:uncharacterized protein (TIGR02569 family)
MAAPSAEVLQAFGIQGDPSPIAGGRGLCYQTGDIILKPSDGDEEAQWSSELATRVLDRSPTLYRLSRPLSVKNSPNLFVFEGWTASSFLAGTPGPAGCFADILSVSQAFHADLLELAIEKPEFMNARSNRWSEADRVTWGEKTLDDLPNVSMEMLRILDMNLKKLKGLMKPMPDTVANQLIHADLTGNVIFDRQTNSPPGIIDLTPYWKPAAYAEAIVVADGLTWHGEDRRLVELYGTDEVRLQLLVRAMYWRNLTWAIDTDLDWVQRYINKANFQGALDIVSSYLESKS